MQRVVEQNVIAAAQQMEEQLDGELHRLENLDEDDLDRLRERRIKQLKQQAVRRQQWLARGHGEYQDIPAEKEFFAAMKGEERMVCHFYRENWPCKVRPTPHLLRCLSPAVCMPSTLDAAVQTCSQEQTGRLSAGHGQAPADAEPEAHRNSLREGERLSGCHTAMHEPLPPLLLLLLVSDVTQRHLHCSQIHAEKSPFLTERLKIFMLPTLALIQHERTIDYVVGFDDLGGTDDFSTEILAARLEAQVCMTHLPNHWNTMPQYHEQALHYLSSGQQQ